MCVAPTRSAMLIVGSDDGAYRLLPAAGDATPRVRQVLASGRVMRLRRFDGVAGVFAATADGLYHSRDGLAWTALDVPREAVYAVGADPAAGRLYAGTRPAHVYATELPETEAEGLDNPAWTELEGLHELPSRAAWRTPRHEGIAQVRDVVVDPAADRLLVGVEVGGVAASTDGGATWRELDDPDDDVHELDRAAPDVYVAAAGNGLYRTTDGGETWARLDEAVPQSYFRRVCTIGDTTYASGALANSTTWNDDSATPALFALDADEATLTRLSLPRPSETVTGLAALDGDLIVATHLGGVFRRTDDEWTELPPVPTRLDRLAGRYTPLCPAPAPGPGRGDPAVR